MRLYLVQHGEAKSETEDPQRPLTIAGAEDVRRVAQLAVNGGSITAKRILHSGKTRAQQTAAIWGEAIGIPIEPADDLAPLDDPAIWVARITAGATDTMLVGHLPHLSSSAAVLQRILDSY